MIKKTFLLLFLLLTISACTRQASDTTETNVSTNKVTEEIATSSLPSTSPAIKTLTYNDNSLNFSFRYPGTMKISKNALQKSRSATPSAQNVLQLEDLQSPQKPTLRIYINQPKLPVSNCTTCILLRYLPQTKDLEIKERLPNPKVTPSTKTILVATSNDLESSLPFEQAQFYPTLFLEYQKGPIDYEAILNDIINSFRIEPK